MYYVLPPKFNEDMSRHKHLFCTRLVYFNTKGAIPGPNLKIGTVFYPINFNKIMSVRKKQECFRTYTIINFDNFEGNLRIKIEIPNKYEKIGAKKDYSEGGVPFL